MKTFIILIFSSTLVWGQNKKNIIFGAGIHYNKYPTKGFENYALELSTMKNQNLEFGLNTRLFYTQNLERINQLDPLFQNSPGEKYFQFQNNTFIKLYPFKLKLSPYVFGEIGYQIANSKSRNLNLLKEGSFLNPRSSYNRLNLSIGLGFKYIPSKNNKFSLSVLSSLSNNKVREKDLNLLSFGYNFLYPVKNLSCMINFQLGTRRSKFALDNHP